MYSYENLFLIAFFVNSTNLLQKMGNILSFYYKERTEVLYFTLYVEGKVSFFHNRRYNIIHNIC